MHYKSVKPSISLERYTHWKDKRLKLIWRTSPRGIGKTLKRVHNRNETATLVRQRLKEMLGSLLALQITELLKNQNSDHCMGGKVYTD